MVNAVTGGIFIMAWIPTMIDIVTTPTIDTLAVSVNMCSSGTNDFILWFVMFQYRNDVRMLLEWCESLYIKQTELEMNAIAAKIFTKCAKKVLFYQRYDRVAR